MMVRGMTGRNGQTATKDVVLESVGVVERVTLRCLEAESVLDYLANTDSVRKPNAVSPIVN